MSGAAGIDSAFIKRTYRSVLLMTAFVLLLLWAYRLNWAFLPLVTGIGLALVLLWTSERVIPQIFKAGYLSPKIFADANIKNTEIQRRLHRLIPIVLVKYLSVGVIAFVLVRFWSQREILVFCGGFVLVQVNVVMRVISRILTVRPMKAGKSRWADVQESKPTI